jgi:hypothetical protein
MLRQSFVSRPEGRKTPRADPANVDFLLLSSEEFADVSQGGGTALFSVAPGHDHEVEFLLPAPPDDPDHCDLVFRNSRGGVAGKNVPADFSLTFGEQ